MFKWGAMRDDKKFNPIRWKFVNHIKETLYWVISDNLWQWYLITTAEDSEEKDLVLLDSFAILSSLPIYFSMPNFYSFASFSHSCPQRNT